MSEFAYAGSELHIFEHARRWKAYFTAVLAPWLGGEILVVGAGIGANTQFLEAYGERWTCLEPDRQLLEELVRRLPRHERRELILGTLEKVGATRRFDAIVYVDVLEHIEDDSGELRRAAAHLNPGGRLIVLSPAHGWLYSPFDRKIGHYRRYTKAALRAVAPAGLREEALRYLDSAGLLASAANQLLLRSEMPTLKQIQTWDRWLVPVSRRLDRVFRYSLGKSVIAVWSKPA
jgi:2-polyprenyl-3-methyl-5-hydroxy-6-metoxy-1,4-benzoquinol methylase